MKTTTPFKKNDIIELEITDVSTDGAGFGRYEGMAVFVQGAAPGDKLEALVLKVSKNYAYAKPVRWLELSADRIDVDCPVFPRCGGCTYRHISYEAEKTYKYNKVKNCINRIGGVDIDPLPLVSVTDRFRYRNKAVYPFSADGKIGFFASGSHRVIECEDCLLQPDSFAEISKAVLKWAKENGVSFYNEATNRGNLRRLYLRKAEKTGQIMVVPIVAEAVPDCAEKLVEMLKNTIGDKFTLLFNINSSQGNAVFGEKYVAVYGSGYIDDILCGLTFRLSPQSFYQVNRTAAEKLYEIAAEFADAKNKTVLDLYCGAGTIGLSMAKNAKQVIGVEIVEPAVCDAKINAELNGITNARFICADAASAAKQLAEQGVKPDVVIVDPPRKGCDAALLGTLANEFSPERIVYVSCDPATLARDIKILDGYGYSVKKVVPVDMFPATAHVESVVCLSREKADDYVRISVHTKDLLTKEN